MYYLKTETKGHSDQRKAYHRGLRLVFKFAANYLPNPRFGVSMYDDPIFNELLNDYVAFILIFCFCVFIYIFLGKLLSC
uniref:Uncharacterized protein n=1 Tax=Rhizophora mucronata TaxID=61149 RepID=A0A2P2IT21_RHIMU